ncbi:MAG: DUF3301 domain-containing protein [Gammaproteobacteria bacterium]|nr:MAG: DUF3301 domain-containing protein [Gammaproteobacteria bacterium]
MIDNGLAILLLVAIAWFWWESRGVAEMAIRVARRSCDSSGVQLLNDTVGWEKVRLKRNDQGRMQVQRTYFFEFSTDIERRYKGVIVMLGKRLSRVEMEAHRIT